MKLNQLWKLFITRQKTSKNLQEYASGAISEERSYTSNEILNQSKDLSSQLFSTEQICRAFENEIEDALKDVPYARAALRRVIRKLGRLVYLVPASEHHHSSKPGGLLLHSLRVAALASQFAKNIKEEGATYAQNYNSQIVAPVGGFLVGISHDLGKLLDITITDEKGQKWYPVLCDFETWISEIKAQKIHLTWNKDRIHKEHEKYAFAFLMKYLLTNELQSFLEKTNPRILEWVRDALVNNEGPYKEVLDAAEHRVVQQEMRDRCMTDAADCINGDWNPQALFTIEALRQLQCQEKITVNRSDSDIYCTRSGALLVLSESLIEKIRSYMLEKGITSIPSTVNGVIDCLALAKTIVPFAWEKNGAIAYVWPIDIQIERNRIRRVKAIRFDRWDALFAWDEYPSRLASCISEEYRFDPWNPEKELKEVSELDFRAKSACEKKKQERPTEKSAAEKAKDGCREALSALLKARGGAASIFRLKEVPSAEPYLVFSSEDLEQFLRDHSISGKSFEVFLALGDEKDKIRFDSEKNLICFLEKNHG